MQLARDAAHLMDPTSAPPMLAAPSADAPTLGTAPYVVIARVPARVVNGYAETLWLGSTRDRPVPGWVSAGVLLPFRSTTAPGSNCTPTLDEQRPGRGADPMNNEWTVFATIFSKIQPPMPAGSTRR